MNHKKIDNVAEQRAMSIDPNKKMTNHLDNSIEQVQAQYIQISEPSIQHNYSNQGEILQKLPKGLQDDYDIAKEFINNMKQDHTNRKVVDSTSIGSVE